MIHLRHRTLRERIMRWISPTYRDRQDAATREAIGLLIDNPALPCMVGDRYIPNGYGTARCPPRE